MQSHLVFAAETKVKNEFLLASLASKAAHRMHKSGERTEDTANKVFTILGKGDPVEMPSKLPVREMPSVLPPGNVPARDSKGHGGLRVHKGTSGTLSRAA